MADGIKISALTEATDAQTVDGNLLETAVVDSSSSTGFSSKKTPISRLAQYVLSKFTGLSLGGSARTVKTAIDALQTDVDKKADADGEYDNLIVGTSKQLLSESYTIDRTPYKFRKSPYTDRLSESIVGASVAWNQLVQNNGNFVSTTSITRYGITMEYDATKHTYTVKAGGTATATFNFAITTIAGKFPSGHKILVLGMPSGLDQLSGIFASFYNGAQGNAVTKDGIVSVAARDGDTASNSTFYVYVRNGYTVPNDFVFTPQIVDLPAMFGSTVADALYAMGDEGLKLFRSWYPNDYYPFSNPTMEHVSGLESHDMVGFNQWDETKTYTNTLPYRFFEVPIGKNNLLYMTLIDKNNSVDVTDISMGFREGDTDDGSLKYRWVMTNGVVSANPSVHLNQLSDGTFLPYVFIYPRTEEVLDKLKRRFDICINLSDPTRNGQYKPYSKHTYALDASLTLRGILKYDATKGIYADGDVYEADGTVTRKYGIRAYQSGDESNTAVLTDGTNTVYELATPTTETAEPFEEIQITDGTEEYVSDCLAPVGHESKYYANLRSKIEGLPTDFSAIICATEATNKASRNYAVGDYLIYNNTLYKVTTAIASDATLTVGTNITATTIMAEIKALQ